MSLIPTELTKNVDEWTAVSGAGSSFTVVDPASGEPLATFRSADPAEVDSIVTTAKGASAAWGSTSPAERADVMLKLADRLEAAGEDFAVVESANVGRPVAYVREEIAYDVDVLRFMAGATRVAHAPAAGDYVPGTTSTLRREPLSVVGLITPWNYPLMEAMWKIAPALAAGNAVVIKPSELTPLTTLMFLDLADEVLPAGVLNVVLGDGRTGQALVEHPAIRLVSLTGDVSTGKKVAAVAAQSLTRVHLELGGKAPAVVFADYPVADVAAQLVSTAYLNSGQDCTAPCRIIVEDSVYDEFVAEASRLVGALKVGDPAVEGTEVGPVISEHHLDRVAGFVERAREAGATIVNGGTRLDRPGFFYAPTLVTDVEQDAEIVQKEVFGPVVTVQRGGSEAEMLAMANGVEYGLAASVWTRDLDRAGRLTRELAFGTVWVNQHLVLANEMPFGGFGQSGYGKELSAHAIDEYSQLKHVMVKHAAL